jgi:hypothetical protein
MTQIVSQMDPHIYCPELIFKEWCEKLGITIMQKVKKNKSRKRLCCCIENGIPCELNEKYIQSRYCIKHHQSLLVGYGPSVKYTDKDYVCAFTRKNTPGQQIYNKTVHDHYPQWCALESVKYSPQHAMVNPKLHLHRVFIDGVMNVIKISGGRFLVKISDEYYELPKSDVM